MTGMDLGAEAIIPPRPSSPLYDAAEAPEPLDLTSLSPRRRAILGLYNQAKHPRALRVVIGLGANEKQASAALGISVPTLIEWKRLHPEFLTAAKLGRDDYNSGAVENSLQRRATGYDYTEVRRETVTLKGGRGEEAVEVPAERVTATVKHIPPDVAACIFYLVNRTRDTGRWKHVQRVEVTGADGQPLSTMRPDMTEAEARATYQAAVKAAGAVIRFERPEEGSSPAADTLKLRREA